MAHIDEILAEKLIKEVFGENVQVIYPKEETIFVREKSSDESFLSLYLNKDEFILKDKQYFMKTLDFSKKYQENFGGVVNIKLEYIGKKEEI